MFKKILLVIVLLFALSMTCIVATISVKGLLTMFPLGIYGLLFFIIIELGKIVSTTALHTYSNKLQWYYKTFAVLVILIGMLLTSSGIYGFLSKAYKESYSNLTVKNTQVSMLNNKQQLLSEEKTLLLTEIGYKQKRIQTVSNQRSQQETRMDSLYSKNWVSAARRVEKAIKEGNININNLSIDITNINTQVKILNDSINSYELQKLNLNNNNEAERELSTLQYLSDLSGKSLDEVVSWFILLLVIIGDPQAVLLVIIFNKVINSKEDEIAIEEVDNIKLPIYQNPPLVPKSLGRRILENTPKSVREAVMNHSDEIVANYNTEFEKLTPEDLVVESNEESSSYDKLVSMAGEELLISKEEITNKEKLTDDEKRNLDLGMIHPKRIG